MTASRLRLFVAFDVPLAHREAVAARIERYAGMFPGARWTEVESQHITLRFIGWADAADVATIALVCGQAAGAIPAGEVTLGGLGAFPSENRVRVLWMGIDDPGSISTRLAAGLDRRLTEAGFEGEGRRFTPHLTLARLKTPARIAALPEVDVSDLGPFSLDHIVLYRSHLSPDGARYEALERFPLGA